MEVKLIECKLIDTLKVPGNIRSFNKEYAKNMADSIKIDGQLMPAAIRRNKKNPGRYILIHGKHRLYALKNILKEQFIACIVDEDMDDAEAAIVSDVENLWRNPLTKAQHAGALKRWMAHWVEKNPKLEAKAVAPVAVAPVAEDSVTTETDGQSDKSEEPVAEADPVVEPAKPRSEAEFDNKVAAMTGQSLESVRRTKRIAKAFTAEQLEVLDQMEVTQTDMIAIASIKDETKRAEIIALIASAMDPAEAMKEVMKDEAPRRQTGEKKDVAETKAKSKAEVAPELSDDEWFDLHCSDKAGMLANPARFRSDALLYRKVNLARLSYRKAVKKVLADTKAAGNYGPLYGLILRDVSISHPKDFLICPVCAGKAEVVATTNPNDAVKCPKCFGGGYLLKTEEYL